MSGDLEREGDGGPRRDDPPAVDRPALERSDPGTGRPGFLPPSGGHPRLGQALVPPAQPLVPLPPSAPRAPRRPLWAGALWNAGVLVAAAVLLVSAFLPWVRAQVLLSAFGQTMTRDLGFATGLDADAMVAAIPVLALTAFGMAFWGLIVDDQRVSSLTAVPGGMALVTSGIFLLRLDETRAQLVGPGTPFGYEITPAYGWYLAVAASLLVLGFGLARPVVARVSTVQPPPEPVRAPSAPLQPQLPPWREPGQEATGDEPERPREASPDGGPEASSDPSADPSSDHGDRADQDPKPGRSATWSPP